MNQGRSSKEERTREAYSGYDNEILCASCGSAVDHNTGYYNIGNGAVCKACYVPGKLYYRHSER